LLDLDFCTLNAAVEGDARLAMLVPDIGVSWSVIVLLLGVVVSSGEGMMNPQWIYQSL
jgi:hypothetical protein